MQYCNVFLMLFCNNLTSAWKTRSQAPAKMPKETISNDSDIKNNQTKKYIQGLFLFFLSSCDFVLLPFVLWQLSFSVPYISGCWILLRLESHRGIRYRARPVASANCSTSRGAFPLPCHLHRRPCPTGSYTAPGISRAGYGSLQGGDNPATRHHPKCTSSFRYISDKTGISKLMHNFLVSFVEMAIPFFQFPPTFRIFPVSCFPSWAARINGVRSSKLRAFTSAPCVTKRCATCKFPVRAAMCNGVSLPGGTGDHSFCMFSLIKPAFWDHATMQKTNKTPIQHQSIQNGWAPMENSWKFYQWPPSITIQHMFLMPKPSETHSSQASLAFGSDPPSNSCRTSRGDPSDAATCNSVQPKASVLSLALTEISESFCWSPWQRVRSRTENPMVNAANVRMRMSGMFGSEGLFCRLLVGLDVEKTGASELSSCKSHADEGSSSIGTRFVCSETRVEAVLSRAMSAALTCSRDMKVTMKAIIDLDLRLQRQKNQRRMSREDWEVAVPQLDRQLAEFM